MKETPRNLFDFLVFTRRRNSNLIFKIQNLIFFKYFAEPNLKDLFQVQQEDMDALREIFDGMWGFVFLEFLLDFEEKFIKFNRNF